MKELGYTPAPIRDVRDMIMLGRRLLEGEAVEATIQGRGVQGARLRFMSRRGMPVYLTASGPRMLPLGGELCDGVLFMAGIDRACIAMAMDTVQQGAEQAGRSLDAIDQACCVFGSLDSDGRRARDTCRPIAAWFVQSQPRYVEVAGLRPAGVEAIKAAFSGSAHGAEAQRAAALVTEEAIDKFTLVGDAGDFRARIEEIVETGVRHIEFFPEGEDHLGMVRTFGEQIIPRFK